VEGEDEGKGEGAGREKRMCIDARPVIMLINVTGYRMSAGRTSLRLWLFANVIFTTANRLEHGHLG
jgi:hypothetical protein